MDEVLQATGFDESAHTIGRKSARSGRVEIITRGKRRRSWTLGQKREIVLESLGPELTPSEVARKARDQLGAALHVAAAIAERDWRGDRTRHASICCGGSGASVAGCIGAGADRRDDAG